MIKSIELENFKSHKKTYLELKKGINLIVGIIGSGKTSILDAICYSLFGTFPKLKTRKISIKDLIRRGEKEAKVKIKIEWKNKEYEIERQIKENKSDAWLRENGKLLEKGQKNVTEKIKKILSVDYDLFTKAIYSEQNSIIYFINLSAGERKNEIDKLLGLDKFEIARKNIGQIINQIKQIINTYSQHYDKKEHVELVEKIKKEKNELLGLKKEKEEKIKEMNKLNQGLKDLEEKNKEIKKMKTEYELMKNKKIRLESKIEKLNKKEIKKEKILSLKNILENEIKRQKEIEEEKKNLNKKLQLINKKIAKLEFLKNENNENKRKLREIEDTLKKINISELEKHIKQIRSKIEEIELLKIKKSEMENQINELKKDISKCPICESDLSNEKKQMLIKTKKEEITKIIKKTSLLEELKTKKREIERKIKTYDLLKSKKEEIKIHKIEDYTNLLKNREEIERKIKNIKQVDITQFNQKKDQYYELVKKYNEWLEFIKLNKELKQINNLIEKYKGIDLEYEQMIKKQQKFSLKIEQICEEIKIVGRLISEKQKIITHLISKAKEYENILNKIKKYNKLFEELVLLKNTIITTQEHLRKNTIKAINIMLKKIWPAIYPYKDYSDIRLHSENGYEFQLYCGKWVNVENASGGETEALALALRIALAIVLTPNLSWLILDEPTHNLDENTTGKIAETIKQKLPNIIKQSIIISHNEHLIKEGDIHTYIFNRDKNKDEETKII